MLHNAPPPCGEGIGWGRGPIGSQKNLLSRGRGQPPTLPTRGRADDTNLADEGEDVVKALKIRARIEAVEGTVPNEIVCFMIIDGLSPYGRVAALSQAQPGGVGETDGFQPGLDQPHRTRRRLWIARYPPQARPSPQCASLVVAARRQLGVVSLEFLSREFRCVPGIRVPGIPELRCTRH